MANVPAALASRLHCGSTNFTSSPPASFGASHGLVNWWISTTRSAALTLSLIRRGFKLGLIYELECSLINTILSISPRPECPLPRQSSNSSSSPPFLHSSISSLKWRRAESSPPRRPSSTKMTPWALVPQRARSPTSPPLCQRACSRHFPPSRFTFTQPAKSSLNTHTHIHTQTEILTRLLTHPRDVIVKLLAFTFAMIVVPIGSYFLTVNTVFSGKTRRHPRSLPTPSSISLSPSHVLLPLKLTTATQATLPSPVRQPPSWPTWS